MLQSVLMREKDRFFAIIPIHGLNKIVEEESVDKLQKGINEVLKKPEEAYPFHDFRNEITVIRGRKTKLPQ